MKKIIVVFIMALMLGGCGRSEGTLKPTASPTSTIPSLVKIDPDVNLCNQIGAEFVTEATGIDIARVKNINDVSINACDYYLTDENNSPYIAIIVNKNLDFEKQKQIAQKMKFGLKTDEEIEIEHYVAWADSESRMVNINLVMDVNNFIRVDKNVERAIDNDGLIKLARAVAKRL